MSKTVVTAVIAAFLTAVAFAAGAMAFAQKMMFVETVSPFGLEETVARIQQNIQANPHGWVLSGLRNPAKAIQNDGRNTLPVMMVEACSTRYSRPILNMDERRILSILMPCKITVFKTQDGSTHIGRMNTAVMGWMFGSTVHGIMDRVADDQRQFLTFDASKPAPLVITSTPGGGTGGSAPGGGGGC